MTQNPTPETLKPEDEDARKQGEVQDLLRALQQGAANKAVRERMKPNYPAWPTSKRGPISTPPPPGSRPINPIRSEQVAEVGYNQETGEPGTQSSLHPIPNEAETAQEGLRKRKERL